MPTLPGQQLTNTASPAPAASERNVRAAFADAMRVRGLISSSELIADGAIHRCKVEGAPTRARAGAYLLHIDERQVGVLENCKGGPGDDVDGNIVLPFGKPTAVRGGAP
jgi:hypothetical protein